MPKILTADKAIDVLEAIVTGRDGAGTRELARKLRLNVATVHNIARTLAARGYLRQAPRSKRFYPGVRLMLLGRHDRFFESLAELSRPHIERVAAELDESVMLGAFDADRIANLCYIPSRQALRVQEPDDIGPIAYCTALGKLMLAHMPEPQLDAYLRRHPLRRFTRNTIVKRDALAAALAQIRDAGFSVASEELSEGVSAIAVPVRDPWGAVVGAIGASAPTIRMKQPRQRDRTLSALQAVVKQVQSAWERGA